MSLKILRGNLVNLPTLDAGRLAVTLDAGTERMYVGITSGNLRLATYPDLTSQISTLKGSPPLSLNTLEKLADAIDNDPSYFNTVNSLLSQKASLAQLSLKADLAYVNSEIATVNSALALKVDIITNNAALALKADLSYLNTNFPTTADVPSYAAADTDVHDGTTTPTKSVSKSKLLIYYSGGNAPVTAQLPSLASPSIHVGWTFQLFKPSGASTAVTFQPNGSDTINGVAGNLVGLTTDRQVVLVKKSATDWRYLVVG
jgi:hypothetical protein